MREDLSGLRKSAIVLLSLGEQHAAEVLRRLDVDTADHVRAEMQRVGELRQVSLQTRQYVLGQFCSAATAPAPADEDPDTDAEESSLTASDSPFAALQDAQPQSLLDSIREEHPQTIALVLAHLPPDKAGD